MSDTKSKLSEDELDQMIASLQNESGAPAQAGTDPNGSLPTITPIATSQPADNVVTTDDSVQPIPSVAENITAAPVSPVPTDVVQPTVIPAAPIAAPTPIPEPIEPIQPIQPIAPISAPAPVNPASDLDLIKREALTELRPLIDKLNLPAEEKFDTILLTIRSTDDSSLILLANATARQIADDTRRAEALLNVIKEIDFFKQSQR